MTVGYVSSHSGSSSHMVVIMGCDSEHSGCYNAGGAMLANMTSGAVYGDCHGQEEQTQD